MLKPGSLKKMDPPKHKHETVRNQHPYRPGCRKEEFVFWLLFSLVGQWALFNRFGPTIGNDCRDQNRACGIKTGLLRVQPCATKTPAYNDSLVKNVCGCYVTFSLSWKVLCESCAFCLIHFLSIQHMICPIPALAGLARTLRFYFGFFG